MGFHYSSKDLQRANYQHSVGHQWYSSMMKRHAALMKRQPHVNIDKNTHENIVFLPTGSTVSCRMNNGDPGHIEQLWGMILSIIITTVTK